MKEKTLSLGYGTLLHQASASNTLRGSDSDLEFVPVRVPGLRRLFNLHPEHYEESHKVNSAAIEAAAMNVAFAKDAALNGVVFQTTKDEQQRLDKRERYYHSEKIQVFEFSSGASLGQARFYICSPDEKWINHNPKELLPLWRDIVWGRSGAYAISKEFGQFFDETTYLADGRTLVIDAYRDYLLD